MMSPSKPPPLPKLAFPLFLLVVICTTCFAIEPDGSCPLLTMVPFSDKRRPPRNLPSVSDNYGYGLWTPKSVGISGYTHMAAALLAMEHFNARDSSIVPELSDPELATCNVTFPSTSIFVDSAYDKVTSVTEVMKATQNVLPCAIIGPSEPKAVEGTGIMSASLNIPQMAYMNMEPRIGDRDEFPTVVRTIVEQHPFARAVTSYLQREGKERNYVAILHNKDESGIQFARALKNANETNLRLVNEEFDNESPDSIVHALERVKDTGYHTFILITEQPAHLSFVAEEANKLGIIGEKYFWMISGAALSPEYFSRIREVHDSPLDRLLRGAAIFRVMDGFTWNPSHDKFLASWRNLDGSFVERLDEFYPLKNQKERLEYFEARSDFFQDERYRPSEFSSFVYDSVIAVGIGACRSQLHGSNEYRDVAKESVENRHIDEILKTSFQGASGEVKFYENDGSRDAQGVMYGIYNTRAGEMKSETGKHGYDAILTARNDKQLWEDIEGETFLFASGTQDQPMPLINEVDANFLSPSVQAIGLFLMSLSLAISLGSAGWVWYMRKERSIQAAQPVFLYLICFGSILMTLTNLTMSFDESYGLDATQLGFACNIRVWLFILGYMITYAALFSKLLRINKIFQFRRQKVNIRQVLKPFACLLISTTILLTLWISLYPMWWERRVVTEVPLVTYGECLGDHILLFILPIVILMAASTILTAVMAWRTKDIQAEFSESSWIFYGIFTQIQAWVVCLPVIMILRDEGSSDAFYLGKALMFLIFSVSIVVLIIWPKMIRILRKKVYGDKRRSERSRMQIPSGGNGSNVRVSGLSDDSLRRLNSHTQDSFRLSQSSLTSTQETQRLSHSSLLSTQDSRRSSKRSFPSSTATAIESNNIRDQIDDSPTRQKSVRFNLDETKTSSGKDLISAMQGLDPDKEDEETISKTEYDNIKKEYSNMKDIADQKSKLLDDAHDQVCKKDAEICEKNEELKAALEKIVFLQDENQKVLKYSALRQTSEDEQSGKSTDSWDDNELPS